MERIFKLMMRKFYWLRLNSSYKELTKLPQDLRASQEEAKRLFDVLLSDLEHQAAAKEAALRLRIARLEQQHKQWKA